MNIKLLLLLLFTGGFLIACKDSGVPAEVDGWKPVYKKDIANIPIESEPPKPVERGGKIYVDGNRLFQVESNKGIHVMDISNPASPQQMAFIAIGGATEVAVKNNFLYSNNYDDLIVVDISDIHNAHLQSRIPNTFQFIPVSTPPELGYFECVDEEREAVVDWEYTTLHAPKCKY